MRNPFQAVRLRGGCQGVCLRVVMDGPKVAVCGMLAFGCLGTSRSDGVNWKCLSEMARRRIEGIRAVVTGASSGIGREIAFAMGRAGAEQLLVARREERLRTVAEEVQTTGARVEVFAGDVTDPAARAGIVDACRERFGGLDVLINNAGIGALGYFADASEDRLRQIMEVNFFALVELTRAAIPLLSESEHAIVVNVSSVLGHCAVPRMAEYCASKFAVQGFSDAVRPELATLGIDVLVVSPGTTESEFFDNLIERRTGALLPGRPRTPASDVARDTVRAIERGRREIIPSRSGRLLCLGQRLVPRLTQSVIAWIDRREASAAADDTEA